MVHLVSQILPRRPHASCFDCSHLPQTSSYGRCCQPLIGQIYFMTDFTFPLISDQASSALPYKPASPCNCWVIITKPYQVVPRSITSWSLIILSSLKPMIDFAHWICLIVCASLIPHMEHLRVTPSINGFAKSITLLVSSSLHILGLSASLPCMITLSMK
jgi:hypothetical protein